MQRRRGCYLVEGAPKNADGASAVDEPSAQFSFGDGEHEGLAPLRYQADSLFESVRRAVDNRADGRGVGGRLVSLQGNQQLRDGLCNVLRRTLIVESERERNSDRA